MMLELNDVMKIIGDNNVTMHMIINKWEMENSENLSEFRNIINAYTANICKCIEKAENERVCSMLEGMEKIESKVE